MSRTLAIDYGAKRTGLAVTDPLGIIASPLQMVPTSQLEDFLESYFQSQTVGRIVLGEPKKMDGSPTHATPLVKSFRSRIRKLWPDKELVMHDERFTSKIALNAMIDGGMKKSARRQKGTVDKISATIILQSYLASQA
ncbi:MAG: Holliday junction resolvase RuvX [Bacteroidota bacterium]